MVVYDVMSDEEKQVCQVEVEVDIDIDVIDCEIDIEDIYFYDVLCCIIVLVLLFGEQVNNVFFIELICMISV